MEDNLLLVSIFLSFMLLILNVGKMRKNKNSDKRTSNLPPGPWKLPILGSIHHLISSLPHHKMRELSKKYGPLMHLQLGETPTIVVSSKEIAKLVLKTNDGMFAQRAPTHGAKLISYGCTDIVFSPYGEYWRQVRKIATLELFSAKRVKSFQSIREEEVSNLIKYISNNIGSTINLTDEIVAMTFNIVVRAAFGAKSNDQEEYILFIKEIIKVAESFSLTNLFPSQHWLQVISPMLHKLKRLHNTSDEILEKIINRAKTKNCGDGSLLSYLLNLKDQDSFDTTGFHLTINNIKAVIQDIILAGTDTSSTTTEWVFSEMMKNPRVMKKAQEEIRQAIGSKGYVDEMDLQELKFLKAVIKETLRMHPPGVFLLPRECIETCEINGYTIPVGTQVIVNSWAIGRDQKYWNDGDKFYPERFIDCPIDYKGSNFELLAFGAGKRMCPGVLFATPNMELALAQLLYSFDWQLPYGTSHENFDMTESFGATVKRKSDLIVIPIPYNP